MISYLGNLTLRLAAGVSRLDDVFCRRQADAFRRYQTAEGGFAGREGDADLYYTGFALRGLALVDALDESIVQPAAGFLRTRLTQPMPSVDFLSAVYSAVLLELVSGIDVFAEAGLDRLATVAEVLQPLRRNDGGYAKTPASRNSSTYHTFLAISARQLVGLAEEEPGYTVALVRTRQRADGGFVELDQLRHSGTNPTAAAIGLLRLLDAVDESTTRMAAAFLSRMQNAEGGLRANTRIPVADLLSTFTGLVALADLDAAAAIDLSAVRQYVEAAEHAGDGFRGGAWDDAADVEYTFYGLASLALLADLAY